MFGNFIMRKLLESKLKDLPAEQREKILAIVEKNPALLQKVALEAQEKMKQGKSQQDAMMEVMKNHESELRDAMK